MRYTTPSHHSITRSTPSHSTPSQTRVTEWSVMEWRMFAIINYFTQNGTWQALHAYTFDGGSSRRLGYIRNYTHSYELHTVIVRSEWSCQKHNSPIRTNKILKMSKQNKTLSHSYSQLCKQCSTKNIYARFYMGCLIFCNSFTAVTEWSFVVCFLVT